MSISVGKNDLIQAIASSNQGPEHPRTECLNNSELEVNKEQCKWCRSNRKCSIAEGDDYTGKIEIQMISVEDGDKDLLQEFFEDHLFHQETGLKHGEKQVSKNLSNFLFFRRSPFVFSEFNEYKKKMICQPVNHRNLVQPIHEDSYNDQPKFTFSSKLAYSPSLRRHLTIFELQLLNSLWHGGAMATKGWRESPSCKDFFRLITEKKDNTYSLNRDIENRINEESSSLDHIGLLMRRGSEMVAPVWEYWREGVEVDFFKGLSVEKFRNPLDWIKLESLSFLDDFIQSMMNSKGSFNEDLSDVIFVEPRSNGIIFQSQRNKIPDTKHLGTRIVKEICVNGLTNDYILIDREDYFRCTHDEPSVNLQKKGNTDLHLAKKEQFLSISDSPLNEDVLRTLNFEIRKQREDALIFDSMDILDVAMEGEKGYFLFDVFEFKSSGNFHDIIRKQQLSNDYDDLVEFFNYLRSIGEIAKKSKNTDIGNLGEEFLENVKPELLAREPDPLKIIESIIQAEGGKYRKLVDLELLEDAQSPLVTETVKFFDHSDEEENVIKFVRLIEKTDSEYRISNFNSLGNSGQSRFKISSDINKFRWPRSVRIYLQNCLSSGSTRKVNESPIIGALYLSPGIRSKLCESSKVAREVVKLLRERAHFSTLSIATEFEEQEYATKKDLGRTHIETEDNSGIDIIYWNAHRSPIESRNRAFVEMY